MGESLAISLGNPLPLSLTIPDGTSRLFPQAVVYDSSDTPVAGSPFDLTEVGSTGRYTSAAFTPAAEGTFTAHYITYHNPGHTGAGSTVHTRTQDSFTVTISPSDVRDGAIHAIESQRGQHTGQVFVFVDPVAGNDANDGITASRAYRTITAALAGIAEHTIIYVLGSGAGQQIINENIVLATRYTFLRGPGLDLRLEGAVDTSPTVSITAEGCSVEGFALGTLGTGTPNAISIVADFALLRKLRIEDARQHGVSCVGGDRLFIEDCIIRNNGAAGAGNGILLDDSSLAVISRNVVVGNQDDNISVQRNGGVSDDNILEDITVADSVAGFGISIAANVNRTRILNLSPSGNSLGDIDNQGTDTVCHGGALDNYGGRINIDTVKGVPGRSYPVGTIDMPCNNAADAKALADNNDYNEYGIRGPFTLADTHDEWRMFGLGAGAEVKLAGQDVDGAYFENIELSQTMLGKVSCLRCALDGVTDLDGDFIETRLLAGALTARDSPSTTLFFDRCASSVSGPGATPVLDLGASRANDLEFNLRAYGGGIEIRNMDRAGDVGSIDLVAGQIILAATCTSSGDNLALRGPGNLTNLGTIVPETDALLNRVPFDELRDITIATTEFQRGTHTAEVYIYVDPTNGDDSNDGLSPGKPKLTLMGGSGAVAAITQEHTAIVVRGNATGQQVINENINLTTPFTFLRGPGLDVQLKGAVDTLPTIKISEDGCEISGFEVTTLGTGTPNGIDVTGDFALLRKLRVAAAAGIGIRCSGDRTEIRDACRIEGCGDDGISITGDFSIVDGKTISTGNAGDGVAISGNDNTIDNSTFTGNGGWGITLTGNRNRVTRFSVVANTLGDLQNLGTDTITDRLPIDVRQSWAPALTPSPLTMNGTVHLEITGERVDLPDPGAACTFQGYLADGSLIAGFSGSGTLRSVGTDSWFECSATLTATPAAGQTIIVRATITGSQIGGGTHNGETAISFPEFS